MDTETYCIDDTEYTQWYKDESGTVIPWCKDNNIQLNFGDLPHSFAIFRIPLNDRSGVALFKLTWL